MALSCLSVMAGDACPCGPHAGTPLGECRGGGRWLCWSGEGGGLPASYSMFTAAPTAPWDTSMCVARPTVHRLPLRPNSYWVPND